MALALKLAMESSRGLASLGVPLGVRSSLQAQPGGRNSVSGAKSLSRVANRPVFGLDGLSTPTPPRHSPPLPTPHSVPPWTLPVFLMHP
jgi:hypothetical protein